MWTKSLSSLVGEHHLALIPFPFHTTTDLGGFLRGGDIWPRRVVIMHVCLCVCVMLYIETTNFFCSSSHLFLSSFFPFLACAVISLQTKLFDIFIVLTLKNFSHSSKKFNSFTEIILAKIVFKSRLHSGLSQRRGSCKNFTRGKLRSFPVSTIRIKNGRTISGKISELTPSSNHAFMIAHACWSSACPAPLKILHARLTFCASRS